MSGGSILGAGSRTPGGAGGVSVLRLVEWSLPCPSLIILSGFLRALGEGAEVSSSASVAEGLGSRSPKPSGGISPLWACPWDCELVFSSTLDRVRLGSGAEIQLLITTREACCCSWLGAQG